MANCELWMVNSQIGKIWFFDSGFGGLQSMKYFRELYPAYDYIFLADAKNCPYGTKTAEHIKELTFTWLHRLFDHGATIVILACNTASAYTIKAWQQQYPDKKVLSITIPGVEALSDKHIQWHIGVLATQATINARVYPDLIQKYNHNNPISVEYIAAPTLVDIIERWSHNSEEIRKSINEYMDQFHHPLDCLILGCTHFPILMTFFEEVFDGIIIDPSYEAACKFADYLSRHPEIEHTLTKTNTAIYYTSWSTEIFDHIGSKIIWSSLQSHQSMRN